MGRLLTARLPRWVCDEPRIVAVHPSSIDLDSHQRRDDEVFIPAMQQVRRTWASLGFEPFTDDLWIKAPRSSAHDKAVAAISQRIGLRCGIHHLPTARKAIPRQRNQHGTPIAENDLSPLHLALIPTIFMNTRTTECTNREALAPWERIFLIRCQRCATSKLQATGRSPGELTPALTSEHRPARAASTPYGQASGPATCSLSMTSINTPGPGNRSRREADRFGRAQTPGAMLGEPCEDEPNGPDHGLNAFEMPSTDAYPPAGSNSTRSGCTVRILIYPCRVLRQ